jgi:hypothetical protein
MDFFEASTDYTKRNEEIFEFLNSHVEINIGVDVLMLQTKRI